MVGRRRFGGTGQRPRCQAPQPCESSHQSRKRPGHAGMPIARAGGTVNVGRSEQGCLPSSVLLTGLIGGSVSFLSSLFRSLPLLLLPDTSHHRRRLSSPSPTLTNVAALGRPCAPPCHAVQLPVPCRLVWPRPAPPSPSASHRWAAPPTSPWPLRLTRAGWPLQPGHRASPMPADLSNLAAMPHPRQP